MADADELGIAGEIGNKHVAPPLPTPQDFDPLSVCPDDEAARTRWRKTLQDWREDARQVLAYDGSRYTAETTEWTQRAFVCGLVMLWEEGFYDPATREFTVDRFLDQAEAAFGGYDVLILWHAYPRIGFDERNQFDFYRDIPGGLDALAAIIERLHVRGVRAVLDYNPWDTGTREEPGSDEVALVEMVRAVGADGIFLDTLANASQPLRNALGQSGVDLALQSEAFVPLEDVADHLISWAQWPEKLDQRLVLRNKWFEPRQMQHLVRRWHCDHRDELHTSWLNGTGIVVWENVFGSWYPWNVGDRQTMANMRSAQKLLAPHFAEGEWQPFVATGRDHIDASSWRLGGVTAWTIVNRGSEGATVDLAALGIAHHAEVLDVLARTRLGDTASGLAIAERGIACLLIGDADVDLANFEISLEAAPPVRPVSPTVPDVPNIVRQVMPASLDKAPAGTAIVPSGPRSIVAAFRLRECGTYRRAPLLNVAYPDFAQHTLEHRDISLGDLAFDLAPVTNRQFHEFITAAGYAPRDRDNFLAHWREGAPAPGTESDPVTYIDLDDARAFARWAGRRLSTEDEWQVAMSESAAGYGSRRVWEWTESEQSDGHTRFVIVKGGTVSAGKRSDWYAESGPLGPERSAKFILFAPGLDRCSTVGFRCVADLRQG